MNEDTRALRIWWIPQIPMQSFYASVDNPNEARNMLNTLAAYDQFQYDFNIKPDYCNMGGLQVLDKDGDWVEWHDDDDNDINAITD